MLNRLRIAHVTCLCELLLLMQHTGVFGHAPSTCVLWSAACAEIEAAAVKRLKSEQPNSSSKDALVQLLRATGEVGGGEGWARF